MTEQVAMSIYLPMPGKVSLPLGWNQEYSRRFSAYAGKGVFTAWLEPGVFEKVVLAQAGHPEWPGGVDLCPDAIYMQLTSKRPEEVFPSLLHRTARA